MRRIAGTAWVRRGTACVHGVSTVWARRAVPCHRPVPPTHLIHTKYLPHTYLVLTSYLPRTYLVGHRGVPRDQVAIVHRAYLPRPQLVPEGGAGYAGRRWGKGVLPGSSSRVPIELGIGLELGLASAVGVIENRGIPFRQRWCRRWQRHVSSCQENHAGEKKERKKEKSLKLAAFIGPLEFSCHWPRIWRFLSQCQCKSHTSQRPTTKGTWR